jgi:hypothetical protein
VNLNPGAAAESKIECENGRLTATIRVENRVVVGQNERVLGVGN